MLSGTSCHFPFPCCPKPCLWQTRLEMTSTYRHFFFNDMWLIPLSEQASPSCPWHRRKLCTPCPRDYPVSSWCSKAHWCWESLTYDHADHTEQMSLQPVNWGVLRKSWTMKQISLKHTLGALSWGVHLMFEVGCSWKQVSFLSGLRSYF